MSPKKDRSESAGESAEPKMPEKIPQPHGGALLTGGVPGNAGGGRPPSVIREKLRGSFEERARILEEIADGLPYKRVDVPFATILKHARCPGCDGKFEADNPEDVVLLTIEGNESASVNDRLKSLDILAKYGLGTTKEITVEHVRDRLTATIRVITETLPKEQADALLARIEPLWR